MMMLMKHTLPNLNSFGSKVKFFALVGLCAALMIDFGDAVWWQIPWAWKLHQSFYNFAAFVIGGLVLAKFIKVD